MSLKQQQYSISLHSSISWVLNLAFFSKTWNVTCFERRATARPKIHMSISIYIPVLFPLCATYNSTPPHAKLNSNFAIPQRVVWNGQTRMLHGGDVPYSPQVMVHSGLRWLCRVEDSWPSPTNSCGKLVPHQLVFSSFQFRQGRFRCSNVSLVSHAMRTLLGRMALFVIHRQCPCNSKAQKHQVGMILYSTAADVYIVQGYSTL